MLRVRDKTTRKFKATTRLSGPYRLDIVVDYNTVYMFLP
jgi:hypothetical protein